MQVRSVLITGAGRGIGLEFVRQFLSLPQPLPWVFATCRNIENALHLKALAAEFPNNLLVKPLEITDVESIKTLVSSVNEDLGNQGLTLLINNAGCLKRLKLSDVNEKDMIESYRIMTLGPLLMSQAFAPLLKRCSPQPSGTDNSSYRSAIVNISTLMASITDNTSGGSYDSRTSKVGLNMITKSLSIDLKDHGILTAVLDPGWVKTELGGDGAKMEVTDSVSRMMKIIQGLSMKDTGTFLNYDGKIIPW